MAVVKRVLELFEVFICFVVVDQLALQKAGSDRDASVQVFELVSNLRV